MYLKQKFKKYMYLKQKLKKTKVRKLTKVINLYRLHKELRGVVT